MNTESWPMTVPFRHEDLLKLLEISARELDDGKGVEFDVKQLVAEGRARWAKLSK